MTKTASPALILIGVLMMFGAVGGMDDAEQATQWLDQLLFAFVGAVIAFVGTLGLDRKDENRE
jgi:hypothetical protein